MAELLPCPFCGDEARIEMWFFTGGRRYSVMCRKCGSETNRLDTEAEAIEAWNTRAERTCHADEVTHRNCKYSINRGWRERTCENVGYYIDSTRFKCSNCGYNGWTKWASDGRDRVPNYCPNCGAKVVDAGAAIDAAEYQAAINPNTDFDR